MVNVSTMECNIPANVVKALAVKNARLIRDLAQKIPAKTISNASMRVKITSASVNRDFQARIAKKMVVHAPLVIPAKMMEFAFHKMMEQFSANAKKATKANIVIKSV